MCGAKITQANANNYYDLTCDDGFGKGLVGTHV